MLASCAPPCATELRVKDLQREGTDEVRGVRGRGCSIHTFYHTHPLTHTSYSHDGTVGHTRRPDVRPLPQLPTHLEECKGSVSLNPQQHMTLTE